MGCGGCAKKKLFLKAKPGGIAPELVRDMLEYNNQKVRVRDLTGQQTFGTLCAVDVDHVDTEDKLEDGNIAIKTLLGISVIGFNIIESIELMTSDQSSITS